MSKHHRTEISTPWEGEIATGISAWLDAYSGDDADMRRRMQGRAVLNVSNGPLSLHLRPTAPELRALAAALSAVADALDGAPLPLQVAA